jgi:peroxiredoxin
VTELPDSDGSPAPPPDLTRLDPDRAGTPDAGRAPAGPSASEAAGTPARPAVPTAGETPTRPSAPPVIDTRRYRWMIGIFGLALVLGISIYQFATHGTGTTGVPPGRRLHFFAAPLAATDLNGDPNLAPPCTVARHDRRALNVCLLAARGPLVLSFFVTGAGDCERQVDALQTLAGEFPTVQFAAVGIKAGHRTVATLARSHHWTIPVAYDRDGAVGAQYGVVICPMAELAYRGGIVRDRLIGDPWQTAAELAPRVRALLAAQRARGGELSPGAGG